MRHPLHRQRTRIGRHFWRRVMRQDAHPRVGPDRRYTFSSKAPLPPMAGGKTSETTRMPGVTRTMVVDAQRRAVS